MRTIPQYKIPRRDGGPPELLRISLQAGDEKVLPVFSFEMLARGFVRCGDLGLEWRVRESHTGELVSLLLGPYADVMRILPTPLPKPLAAEDALLNLLLRGRSLSITPGSGTSPVERLPHGMSYDVSADRRSRRGSEA
jgi:hypothetical protein